ncbi:MAG: FadR family transcriptional regulator [Chloroflexi bacterium]|nr:FadR family transcriptional regulator [Chloroflexota bacterium]
MLVPINRGPIVNEIVERLVGFILSEHLKPGDKLPTERELIERLSVGRSTLREAVKTLSAIGVLEAKQGSGTFVGDGNMSILARPLAWGLLMSQDSVDHVIEARGVIEVTLAGWAAERATKEEIAAIGQILDSLEASQHDMDSYVEHDLEFHIAIAHAAHNPMFSQILSLIQEVMRAWMKITYLESKGASESMKVHRQIFEAIRSGDARVARELMASHTSGDPLRAAAAKKLGSQQDFKGLLALIT